ncbi:MAG TPA: RES family NAD+ phosphorylase [Bryobacteraceae bacterium]|nr:RES family NAD+ phosphorylase [Bryobacteraceae bacterium]
MAQPGAHPDPPPELDSRKPLLFEGAATLYRSHGIDRNPIHFGESPRYRFDSPTGEFGVLYAGLDPECAFIETFGWITGNRILTTAHLSERALAALRPERPMRLIDLFHTGGLARVGADARLTCSHDYTLSRLWSRALHTHPVKADGILYPARHDPTRQAVALFDRGPKLALIGDEPFLCGGSKRVQLAAMMRTYGFKLIENRYEPRRKRPHSSG